LRKLILAVAAASIIATTAQAADPVKIRIGWVAMPSELQPVLFAKEGIARHNGKSYVMEAIHYKGTPLMVTAMATGDLEIAPLAFSAFATSILNAGMTDLRIIADEFQDGVGDYHTNLFLVRKDSPITRVEDLKGKIVASNAAGSAVDLAIRAMLKKHGLEAPRDYTIVEAGFPNLKDMLLEKKVDLIPSLPPFVFDPDLLAKSRVLFTRKDAVGLTETIIWCARSEFLQKNRAAMMDFMEDALRAVRWYIDPANHDEVVKILAKEMKMPPERLADWVFTKKDLYRDPNMLPNLGALQSSIDLMRDLGFLKSTLDVKQYDDLSFVREAATRVK